jgi:bifunctional oligoribonuclease and PAP phosphatase NrnA
LSSKSKQKQIPLSEQPEFKAFKNFLSQGKRILISTHALPDGDGLGAETALFHYLKKARKACRVYNPDPLPSRYNILDEKRKILLGPGEVELWDTFDLWVIVDTNDPKRLGPLWNELVFRAKKIVFLDHHPVTLREGEEIQYPPHASVVSDPESSSIGELLFDLFEELNFTELNKEIALGLYVSVMTDTNSFRYARTTPQAHRIAAKTIEMGINPEEVYQSIFSSKEVSHLKLLGHTLHNVQVAAGGKLAWIELDLKSRKKYSASADDTHSFLNLLLLLKDAEVVCLFREEDNQRSRVSMRSKGKVVINQIAMEFGGGGHEFAAGLSLPDDLESTVKALTGRLEQAIDHYERFGKQLKLTH